MSNPHKLYIQNFPHSWTESHLKTHFNKYGDIDDVCFIHEGNVLTGEITFAEENGCYEAVAKENGGYIGERRIRVSLERTTVEEVP